MSAAIPFDERLSPPDERGCRVWLGSRLPTGYGNVRFEGRVQRSHRVAWTMANGPIPVGKLVLHHCDNPPCCEPTHLFLGTQSDNVADMLSKGRKRYRTKLTPDEARAIRDSTDLLRIVASRYGVTPMTVSMIRRGITWTSLNDSPR